MRIRIEGHDLPGARPGAAADALRLGNVHVGVQRKSDVVDRVPVSAASAVWEFEVASREVDGLLDVGGPWVHGRPGARFLYLSWGTLSAGGPSAGTPDQDSTSPGTPGLGGADGETFAMFRRAKLMFGDVPTALLRAAHDGEGVLTGVLGLTDELGEPVCARVKAIVWELR